MTTIALVDLATQHRRIRDEIMVTMGQVLDSGQFILGDELAAFERDFAEFCGVQYCIGVASGTDALHLALRALEIGPGDEVITAANTFVATVFAICHAGAEPVLVDVEADGDNIDVGLIEEAITDRTKAIIPVHLYGHPARMDDVMRIAEEHGVKVLEDACQAHGAEYQGQRAGSFGHAGCFSFYPGKNLGALGDGGAVVTNDSEIADKIRTLRHCGQRDKNVHPVVGYNSRLDTLQAAVLRVKLRYLDEWNEQRRAAARLYNEVLDGKCEGLPRESPQARHVYHLYVIQHSQRDRLGAALAGQGISCGVHYPKAVNEHTPFRHLRTVPTGAPLARARSRHILSLPMSPDISEEEIAIVADAIERFGEE